MTRPMLPPADPWDSKTGVSPVAEFEVQCVWANLDDNWAVAKPYINLNGELYELAKPADICRVRRKVGGKLIENSELIALAWTKKVLGNGGAAVLEFAEANPGHITGPAGTVYRWVATVGSRLSVAVVKLGGDLEGIARLVPVE